LVALNGVKRNENEAVEEFNERFDFIVQKLHKDIKPLVATTLIFYIDAFDG
jgi:hypothetical protein